MGLADKIYPRLPIWAQNLAIHLEGLRIARLRRRASDPAYLAELRSRESMGRAELEDFRRLRLARHLASAATAPFWAGRFARHDVNPSSEDAFAELAKLPLLTKDEVKEAGIAVHANPAGLGPLRQGSTSGTTGGGLRLVETADAEKERWGVWWRYRGRLGITPFVRCGLFGAKPVVPVSQSSPPYWRRNTPGRQLIFSSFHLSERTYADYVEAIDDAALEWLHGFPTTLALLADLMLARGRRLRRPVRWVTTGAENLQDAHRDKIRRAFGVEPRQHYGLAESVANISECDHGRLHVDEDFAGVELLPLPDLPTFHRIVGTNWSNPAMPLLRYDTGDLATIDQEACPCGLPWRTVRSIDGRLDDMVTLPSGARVGRLAMIFKDFPEIKEAQILQSRPGCLILRVVPGAGFDRGVTAARLIATAAERLGAEARIEIEYLNHIPRTPGGKIRMVVVSGADSLSDTQSSL